MINDAYEIQEFLMATNRRTIGKDHFRNCTKMIPDQLVAIMASKERCSDHKAVAGILRSTQQDGHIVSRTLSVEVESEEAQHLFSEQRHSENASSDANSSMTRKMLDETRDMNEVGPHDDLLLTRDISAEKHLEAMDRKSDTEDFDEIEALRIQLDHDDDRDYILGNGGVEMILDGTQERNEQEEFRLQMALAYFDKGLNYWTDSDLASAMREFSRSLEVREDICGRKDRETAKCYLWVGTIYFLQDAWDRALDEFCRCFRIQCEIAEGNPEACHVVTNWINKCLDALGAKNASKKSLYWTKFKTCIEAEQKGDNLKDNEKYKRAIEHFRSALHLEYSRRDLNPTTPGRPLADCADLYYKIGRCYQLAGKVDCAVMEYRHAFSVYVAKFGLNHRHTIFTMEHIAETITEMGFRDSVADEYVDTIHKSLRHEQTGDWMMDVKKDPSNALKEYEAALKIEGKNVGKTQVACGVLYHKIGKACSELKQTKQALIYFCQAVAIFEPTLGPQHDLTVTSLNLVRECVGISQEGSMCTRSRYCGSHPAQKS